MATTTAPPQSQKSLFARILRGLGGELSVAVPSISRGVGEIEDLIALRNQVPAGANIAFDFSKCGQLSLNALVLLGGLVAFARNTGGSARLKLETIKSGLRTRLVEHGFLAHMGVEIHGTAKQPAGSIPFDHHKVQDKSSVMRYLENSWLGVGAVRLSPDLQAAIMGNVWEVYANAFEHSESGIGIVNCCSYDRPRRRLQLSVMDFGIGIPANVRRYHSNQLIRSRSAMKWAFAEGTSTKAELVGYSRGIGLHTLKEFIKVNKGFMEVFSNDGYAKITEKGEVYNRRTADFLGTLVNITLSADERFYFFAYETQYQNPLGQ